MRLRSIAAIPAGNDGLDDALSSEADAILLTVADRSVESASARSLAGDALPRISEAGKVALVTVSHPSTGALRDDLDALVSQHLGGVFLQHATEPQDIRDLAVALREFEFARGVEPGAIAAFPVIETPHGLLRAAEMAAAAPRIAGLVFAAESFADNAGGRHEEQGGRFSYARGLIVAAARANDRLPLVATYPYQARDLAQQGFAGVVVPGAGGVATVNDAMTPTRRQVEEARATLAAYDQARAADLPVAQLGAAVIDVHAARRARQVLAAAGEEPPS